MIIWDLDSEHVIYVWRSIFLGFAFFCACRCEPFLATEDRPRIDATSCRRVRTRHAGAISPFHRTAMDDEETELRNPFPSPPSHYTNYTTHNLTLLKLLRERAGNDGDLSQPNQNEVLADQTDVPEWPLVSLEKPRVDWIREDGEYTVYGETWLVRALSSWQD